MSQKTEIPIEDLKYEKVPTQALIDGDDTKIRKYGYGIRHVQCIIFMVSLTISYSVRSHLGMTIVGMTAAQKPIQYEKTINFIENSTIKALLSNNNTDTISNLEISTAASLIHINESFESEDEDLGIYRTYQWPKSTQEMVLGSIFLGYCVAMLPFGVVTQRFGGKISLQISLFINAVLSMCTPWLILWGGWKAICVCRMFQGMAQAGTYPSIQTLLAQWVPASELATLSSFVFTGSTVGTVIGFQMSGFLVSSSLRWPSAFWASGALCAIGFCLITIFGAATPSQHKSISQEEKKFILGQIKEEKNKKLSIPVKAIMSNKHVWATFAAHTASGASYVFVYTQLPTYIHFILKFNVKESGVLSSLPYIANFFVCIGSGWLSDLLINKKIVTMKMARQIMNTIGFVVPAICMSLLTFTSNQTLGVFILVSILATHGTVHSGWMISYIDMAPKFSGTLMAIGNTICNGFVLLLPVLVSNYVTDVTNIYQWRGLFLLISTFVFIACIAYIFFVTTDVQPFNDVPKPVADPEADDEVVGMTDFDDNQFNVIRRKSLTPFQ